MGERTWRNYKLETSRRSLYFIPSQPRFDRCWKRIQPLPTLTRRERKNSRDPLLPVLRWSIHKPRHREQFYAVRPRASAIFRKAIRGYGGRSPLFSHALIWISLRFPIDRSLFLSRSRPPLPIDHPPPHRHRQNITLTVRLSSFR